MTTTVVLYIGGPTSSLIVVVVVKVKVSAWPYSPWIRALGRGGISGLVVRALTQNVKGVGLDPT